MIKRALTLVNAKQCTVLPHITACAKVCTWRGAATGSIITSAGVILAGTFAGMMAGEITFLAQLGFAVAVGVLIDTLVVRIILEAALAAFFGRWTW